MKKRGQGKHRRIFAVFLCLCVLFTTQPEIWNGLSVLAAEESETKIVLSFAELSEEIKEQTVPVGTIYEELELPEELNVFMKQTEISSTPNLTEEKSEEETVSGNDPENSEKEAQELQETVAGVTWQSDPAYDGNTEETYIFTAVLPESYTLAEDVSLPQITVTVKESEKGTDFAIQTLLDRITALLDVEEYLALEPDMEEDEDAYAEWEEKLYEYAEEALVIWEEYEALTEEQQAQIPEEELTKLTAWVEASETLSESSQVMAIDGSPHTHCVCGGKLMVGEYNHTEKIIVFDNILASQNGQLLLNSNPVTKDEQSGYQLASGNYYLAADVALDSELVIAEGSEVYICLNNYTISYNRKNGKHRVITVEDGATLNLCTCSDSGSITGGDITGAGGGLYLNNATLNAYGISINGNIATGVGGGIAPYNDSHCNLYKVNIYDNKGSNGGGITPVSSYLNMYGGEIRENTATTDYGGGIATGTSAENSILQDVKIYNNTAKNYAGGLYWQASGKTLTMLNVEISNNIVSNSTARFPAGGVALMQGTISISGTIIISGNQYNGNQSNFWNYCNTNASRLSKLVIADDLDEQSVIGLTNRTTPTEAAPDPVEVASGSNHTITDADWSRFFSDDDTYEILWDKNNNLLKLSYPGSCDLFTILASSAILSPEFKAGETEYTSTVANSVDQVDITATLATTASGAKITIKINGAEADMENGMPKTVGLNEGKNTIAITVTSGELSKTYTIKITREAPEVPADYDVKLNGKGGSVGTDLTSYTYGTKITLPTDWTKTGYDFAGWYDNERCEGTAVTEIPANATGDKEYWAKWTLIDYTITYVLDGGNVSGNPTDYTIESNAITLNNPTKEGYTFTGWSGTDLTGSNNMSVTIASGSIGHRTYTANWELKGYTVTLHTNGGTGGTDLTSYKFGSGAVLPTNWKKTGYVFDGWYEDDSCTGTAITNISGTDTGDKEYWAKWTDNIAPVIGTLGFNYQPKNFWHWLIGKDSLVITVPVTEEGSGADKITYTVTQDGGTAETKTAIITGGEAKITVDADFKGTVSIVCTDKAGNTSAGVTVGAGVVPNGIIIEDNAPQIAFQAANAELLNTGEYKTAPNITVTVTDDKDNAISGGIASVSYQINGGSAKTVPHDYTASMVVSDSFTIQADEITASGIPADGVVISVTATDNAGNSTTQNYTVKVHTHSGTLVPAVAPTCTTAGNKEYYTCTCGKLFSDSRCTSEITDQSSVTESARGHDFSGEHLFDTVGHWKKCSRCAETTSREEHHFETAGTQCTVCDYEKEGQGHTHRGELHAATAPTCTTKGNTAYYTCNCGRWFSDSGCTVEITDKSTVEIAAWGHDFVIKHDQNQHWQQCSRCSLEQSREPHVYDNDTDTDCNVCGYVRTIQHTHSATLVPAKPATCTGDGHEAYYTCSCGKWFSDSGCVNEITDHASVTVGKLGHNFVGQYLFDANGHWKVCSRCNTAQTAENHVFDDDSDTICNKCGYQRTIGTHTHSVEKTVAATEPTCTTAGNRAYYVCSCGKWFSDSACTKEVTAQTVTAALGHDYGDYNYDEYGHWKVCRRCGAASVKHGHNYDNDRDTKCNDCGWVRAISDSGQDEQPTPTPSPTEKPDNPGTVPGMPDNSQPEDKQEPESTGIPEPTEKPSETGKEQQPEGDGEQTVPASIDNGKIAISGEPVATGNAEGMTDTRTVLKLGNGAVIVMVVCAEQEYTAGVADTLAVANAVLTPEQVQLVNNGETIEIRIDVKDISDQVPEQDKEVIENGIEEYRKEVPGLVLGMYVDISMFIRIGEGDWNAITATKEPVEIIIGIPEKLQERDRAYYIIRAHDGVSAFMNDMDDDPSTITVSTDLFSSYAIAYVQAEGTGHKCGLCHICPTFLGICCFVWLAIIILIMIVVIILLRKKKEEQEARDTRQ